MSTLVKNIVPLKNSTALQGYRRGSALLVSFGISLFLLSGCAVGPDFVRPEAPKVTQYNQGGDPKEIATIEGLPQRFEDGAAPVANWWHAFNSKQLDDAVSAGLADNPGLQAAEARLRQSQENLRAGSGIFYPQLSAAFAEVRERNSPSTIGSSLPASIFNLTTLSSSVSYALDIFGGQRRAVEGLAAQVDQQRALTLGTYMMLTGNIVNTSIAIAAYRTQLDETGQLIRSGKRSNPWFLAGVVSGRRACPQTVGAATVLSCCFKLVGPTRLPHPRCPCRRHRPGLFLPIFARNTRPQAGSSGIRAPCAGSRTSS